MTTPAKEKVCVDCAVTYAPRSNAQYRCDACGKAHKLKKYTESRRKLKTKGNGKAPKKEQPLKVIASSLPDPQSGVLAQLIAQRAKLDIAIEVIQGLA